MWDFTYCSHSVRFGRIMTEFYAKIVPIDKGVFKYCVTVWRSHDSIESIWNTKKFIRISMARSWAEKKLAQAVSQNSSVMFIKESDILRRKWNE